MGGSDQLGNLKGLEMNRHQTENVQNKMASGSINMLQVPQNSFGSIRPTTFLEHKPKLLSPEETPSSLSVQKQEELRQKADAIVDSIKKSKLKSKRVHLAFMFASPLVAFFNTKKVQSLIRLNFQKEFDSIQESLKLTKTVVNYYRICATLDNLTTVLLRNPNVLHFSGHGVKNSVKDIGTVASLKQGQGDFLVFEDKKACADLLSESMLKDILVKCKNEIKLVFVSSCHSEFIGDIFFNAGIDHVISIRESEKISDSASIIFAKALYQALYTLNGYTICQAFEAAKGIVALQSEGSEVRSGEHNKYVLRYRHKCNK